MSPQSIFAEPLPNPAPLTDKQKEIIKSTVPLLAEHGTKITTHFYNCMLNDVPELHNIFSRSKQDTGHQAGALAAAVYAYAAHIDDLTPIVPFVDRFCNKHASLNIQPGHYHVVGKYLLEAIAFIVGADVFKGELYEAWYSAYWALANLCVEREAALYKQAGWVGWKEFTVMKRVQEAEDIVSFYLTPKDGTTLGPYRPGQYISVQKYVKELGVYQSRQYSLSDAPTPGYYRISVKRESDVRAVRTLNGDTRIDTRDSAHPGWISTLLHDTLREGDSAEVAYPFGEFYLHDSDAPVVLMSAGVGVTPMLAMLNTLTAENVPAERRRQVCWVQAVRNSQAHPFKARVQELAAQYPEQVTTTVFYSAPDAQAKLGSDYDISGRMDLAKIEASRLFLDKPTAQYYLCGPEGFMASISRELKGRGVDGKRIYQEVFGAGGWVL